ncbi:MAG: hypothetical protein QOD67_5021 [Caballeronia sp.]|jgi:hypothetical protein|nr:hypothetical protein [Caballeronia sp.]
MHIEAISGFRIRCRHRRLTPALARDPVGIHDSVRAVATRHRPRMAARMGDVLGRQF